jgi:FKBP-type peptidyl-prolyl cis-trans isomerase
MRLRIYILLAAAALLLSCSKDRDLLYSNQETSIESFVHKQLEADSTIRVVHKGGATRVVMVEGEGPELTPRGKATVNFAGYDFSKGSIGTSTLFATNSRDMASSSGWSLSDESVFEALELDMTDRGLLQGLRDGMEGVREGEECYILFNGKYAFGKSKIGTIPANAALAFRIWVLSVEN